MPNPIKIRFKEFNAQANIDEFDNTYLRNIADNKLEKACERIDEFVRNID